MFYKNSSGPVEGLPGPPSRRIHSFLTKLMTGNKSGALPVNHLRVNARRGDEVFTPMA